MAGWEYDPDSNRTATEKRVNISNPARDGMISRPEIKGTEASYKDHMYASRNKFKEIDLWLCQYDYNKQNGGKKQHWRESTGLSNIVYAVNDKVKLFVDDLSFNFGYQSTYNPAFEGIKGMLGNALGAVGGKIGSGLAQGLGQGLEFARAFNSMKNNGDTKEGSSLTTGQHKSKWEQSPYWEKTSPIGFNGSLKFNFAFGQAGLYSGLEEVIKPISKLASLFAPVWEGNGDIGYLTGLWPTMPYMLARMLKSILSDTSTGAGAALGEAANALISGGITTVGDTVSAGAEKVGNMLTGSENKDAINTLIKNASSSLNTITQKATDAESAVLQTFNTAITSSYSWAGRGGIGHGRCFIIQVGKFEFGPYLIKDCAWKLDFNQTDEYGFPFKGELTLSQIELIETTTADKVASHFVYS